MIVLAAADNDIRHNVGKSNLRLDPRLMSQLETTDLTDEFRSLPWIKWMEKVDFDNKWDKTLS